MASDISNIMNAFRDEMSEFVDKKMQKYEESLLKSNEREMQIKILKKKIESLEE